MAKCLASQTDLIRKVESLRRRLRKYESVEGLPGPAVVQESPRPDWFQVLFDRCPIPYQSLDAEGCLLEVNDAWLETLDYVRDEVLGRWFGDFLSDQDRDLFRQRFPAIKERGHTEGVLLNMRARDGHTVLAEFTSRVAYGDQGQFLRTHCVFQDVTHRKRAEDALRESESRYRTLVETMSEGAFWQAADGTLLDVNPAALRMFGLTRDEFLARTSMSPAWQVISEDGLPLPGDQHPSMLALKTGRPVLGVVVGVLSPQTWDRVWVEVNAIPEFRPGEQTPHQVLVTLHDVTTRETAEAALRESEVRYRALFEGIHSGVAVYEARDDGRDFVFKDFNSAAERIDHDRRDRLVGRSLLEMRPGVERFGLLDVLRTVWRTGEPTHHPLTLYEDDRLTAWYENYVYRLPSGEIVAVFEDVTERKKAEELRCRSQNELAKAQSLAHVGSWRVILKDGEESWTGSEELCRIYGYPAGMALSRQTGFDRIHPDDHQAVQQAWSAALVDQGPAEWDHRIVVDGHTKWIRVRVHVHRDENGRPLEVTGANQDVTVIRQTEERFLDYQTRLRSLASKLVLTEERERHSLAERLHDDVAQYLVFCKMKLEMIGQDTKDPSEVPELAQVTDTLGRLLVDIRGMTFELSSPLLKVMGLEAAVSAWLRDEVGQKHGIQTEFHDDGQTKPLGANSKALLFRSVRELLINSVKHAQARQIRVAIGRQQDFIGVRVEDDGRGFVVSEALSGQGTGFELFSIRERLADLGGTLELDAAPGRGCKAVIRVPLDLQGESAPAGP